MSERYTSSCWYTLKFKSKSKNCGMDVPCLEAVLKKQEYENGILRVINVEMEAAVPSGVNYASVIQRAIIDVVLGSGKKVTKSVIVKRAHTGMKFKVLKEFNTFKMETTVYRDVLSQMEDLMEQSGDRREKIWCQMLGYTPYTELIFSDIKNEGFVMADRVKGLDLNHGLLVLNALGRFHAMSKILLDKGLIAEDSSFKFYLTQDTDIITNMVKGLLTTLSKAMKEKWTTEWSNIAEHIESQIDVAARKLKAMALEETGFKVINHGDAWNCNLMFKYDNSGLNPVSVRFIDFQVSHINSYIWDLVYFIYSSVRCDIRRKHLTDLYKAYWESLNYNLEFFGFEGRLLSFDEVLKEAERLEYYAFLVLVIFRPIMTADPEHPFQMEKLADKDQAADAIQMEVLCSKSFIDTCGDELKSYALNGII